MARNICTESVPFPPTGATTVPLAPELSLATIGSSIPVIEVPNELPYPPLRDVAYILTLIGHMVVEHPVPQHTIEGLGDKTKSIPNLYTKGHQALAYCSSKVRP